MTAPHVATPGPRSEGAHKGGIGSESTGSEGTGSEQITSQGSASEGAIILGAGRGRRLARGPKAFVSLGDRTLAEHVVCALHAARLRVVVLVLPEPPPAALDRALTRQAVTVVINPDETSGPLGSVCLGLRELARPATIPASIPAPMPAPMQRVLVHPVDHPLVGAEVITQLMRAARAQPPTVARVVPTWQARRGHPIVIGPAGLRALGAVPHPPGPDTTLRDILRQAGPSHDVPVDAPSILHNINTQEALNNGVTLGRIGCFRQNEQTRQSPGTDSDH